MICGRICQSFIVVIVCLITAEITIVSILYFPVLYNKIPSIVQNGLSALYANRVTNHISLLPECAQYDAETFYTLKANSECTFSNIEYDTKYFINSAGLRDGEKSLIEPTVIALGDSFTMGSGVEQKETFVSQLEVLTGVDILNAGISSYGTERAYRLFERLNLSKLKTVIIQYSDNDAHENSAAVRPGGLHIRSLAEYRRISAKHVRKTKYFPFKLVYYFLNDFRKKLIEITIKNGKQQAYDLNLTEVDNFLKIFSKIRSLAPDSSYILTELNGRRKGRSFFLDELKQHFESDNLIDVVEVEQRLSDKNYFPIDGHLNESGHRRVALAIAPYLIQK